MNSVYPQIYSQLMAPDNPQPTEYVAYEYPQQEEYEEEDDDDEEEDGTIANVQKAREKKNNVLPLWGNERSMNLNALILTNIQASHYFKVNLYELKTYHEVIDEIYYKVNHLEPWEKGSRKTSGQTGMCGGVRGVGAGGIVSTAFCLLYKLFTMKLTRKQVNGLIVHSDSPYIRCLGFMYVRYTQPPANLWDWFNQYLEDPEEVDVKAGGGQVMTVGEILRHFLTKLEWFSTLFPRIPVPIQQSLEKKLTERFPNLYGRGAQPQQAHPPPPQQQQQQQRGRRGGGNASNGVSNRTSDSPDDSSRNRSARHIPDGEVSFGEAERAARHQREKERERHVGAGTGTGDRERDRRGGGRSSPERSSRTHKRSRSRSRSRDRHRRHHHSKRDRRGSASRDYSEELAREKDRQRKERDRRRRSRSRDRK